VLALERSDVVSAYPVFVLVNSLLTISSLPCDPLMRLEDYQVLRLW
jgi:hypothetical protein